MLTFIDIVLGLIGSVLGVSPLGIITTVLCAGISVWQLCSDRTRKREIDSLKRENARCGWWTVALGSLAVLFLVLMFAASRKAAS